MANSTTQNSTPLNFGNTQNSPAVPGFGSFLPNTQAQGNPINLSPFLGGLGSSVSSALGGVNRGTTPAFASGASATPQSVGSFAQSQSPNNGFTVAPGTAYTLNGVNYDASGKALNTVAGSSSATSPASAIGGNYTPTTPTLAQINAPNMNAQGQFINDSGSGNNVAEPPDIASQVRDHAKCHEWHDWHFE